MTQSLLQGPSGPVRKGAGHSRKSQAVAGEDQWAPSGSAWGHFLAEVTDDPGLKAGGERAGGVCVTAHRPSHLGR